MPLQKDSVYHLSYYVKLETFSHLTFQPVRIAFVFNNNGDSLTSSFVSDTIWHYRDTIFISATNSTEIEITGADSSSSAVDVDNVKLEKVSSNGIGDYFNQKDLKIYPNPTQDIITIEGTALKSYTIIDMLGRKYKEAEFADASQNTIYVGDLPKGMYFVAVKTLAGNWVGKVVVQ